MALLPLDELDLLLIEQPLGEDDIYDHSRLQPELRSGKAKLTMVTASEKHMYQPGLLYLCFGRMTPDELYRDQASLLEPGIGLVVDPVEEFLLDQNQVKTKGGKTIGYDILLYAAFRKLKPPEER